jgi:hypothetical protein
MKALGDETRLPFFLRQRKGDEARLFIYFPPAPMEALGYETRFFFSCVDEGLGYETSFFFLFCVDEG